MTDAHDTATATLPTPGAGPQMMMVEVALIEESPSNPRKHFDQAKLAELAESIKASGVHQPILLRPLPGHRVPDTWGFRRQGAPLPAYELVAGARRLRACKMASVAEVPAMIRELTDEQALEIQVIENLQREDVTALEEAEGYEALMQHGHANADQVAAKIGKSRAYVYARLKLLDLAPDCREALRNGHIDASRALRIARIPDLKLQTKALGEASRTNYRGDPAMGVREFEGWLQQNVMLRLEHAPFSITAVNLVEGVGSCKDCPKRTGANPDLFADVNSPDLCTDPACHASKAEAHRTALRTQAEAKGMRVIDGKEAKAIVGQSLIGSAIKGYTKLDTRHCLPGLDSPATYRELLGDNGPQPVLIEHPQTKELIEAVPTDEAEAVLVQRGVLKVTEKQINLDERISLLKNQSAARQKRATANALQCALTAAARQTPQPAKVLADAELLREWLKLKIHDMDTEDLCTVFGIEPNDDEGYQEAQARAVARIDRAPDGEVRCCMLAWLMLEHAYRYGDDNATPLITAAARALCINAHDIEAEAVATEKAELELAVANLRAAAAAQAKPAKTAAPEGTSTPRPAAQASPTRGKGKAQKPKADPAPPKTTKAEASAAIAAALRATEEPIQAPAAHGIEAPPAPSGGDAPAPSGEGGAGAGDGAAVETAKGLKVGDVATVKATAANGKWRGRKVTVLSVGSTIKVREANTSPAKAERCSFFEDDLEVVHG